MKLAFQTALLASSVALVCNSAKAVQIEVVEVTSQKRIENIQDVPISVSVKTGEDIITAGVRSSEDLSTSIPAVNISKGGASDQIYIRGIGSGFNGGFEQAVGTYVDGIYMGRSRGVRSSFVDMERVEVLKGPQSLYFGNSSIAGAISISTRNPRGGLEGNIAATWDPQYNQRNVEGGIDIPISNNLAVRVAIRKNDSDGYVKNTGTTNGGDGPQNNDFVGRVTAVWSPTSSQTITLKYTQGDSNTKHPFLGETFNCDNNVSAGTTSPCLAHLAAGLPFDNKLNYEFQTSENDFSTLDFKNAVLNWEVDFDSMSFTSVTGFVDSQAYDLQDLDTGILNIFHASQYDEVEQWSQEFRLASNTNDDLEWMVGVYSQSGDVTYDVGLTPQFINPVEAATKPGAVVGSRTEHFQDEKTLSAFGSLTWSMNEDMRLTLGVRYIEVEKKLNKNVRWGTYSNFQLARNSFTEIAPPFGGFASIGSANDSLKQNDLLPSIKFAWNGIENGMIYASYSAGFKAGGFDFASRVGTQTPSFNEELADSYEVGLKSMWLDNTLRTNLAVFYMDFEGVQQSVVDPSTFTFTVGNAAASSSTGLEADLTWAATDELEISANLTFMDTVFDDFIGSCSQFQLDTNTCEGATIEGNFVAGAQDLSGHKTTFAPSYSGFVSAKHTSELDNGLLLTIAGNVYFTDNYSIQSDFDPYTSVNAYAMLGARIAIADEDAGWEVALVAKNLNNEKVPFFCNDLSGSAGSYRCALNPPRTISIQARYNFYE
jgi:iron complex outermembrane receptor protein